ncbi:MAG: SlyX family protein [Enterobacterales bacterium]|nr:SlyX family protein [Enterobacterales bacterium]
MINPETPKRITDRIEELETKFTFQEDAIEELNQVLICQQKDINRLMLVIENLNSQMERLSDEQGVNQQNETPPHY